MVVGVRAAGHVDGLLTVTSRPETIAARRAAEAPAGRLGDAQSALNEGESLIAVLVVPLEALMRCSSDAQLLQSAIRSPLAYARRRCQPPRIVRYWALTSRGGAPRLGYQWTGRRIGSTVRVAVQTRALPSALHPQPGPVE